MRADRGTARKGRTLRFELVVDRALDAMRVEFIQEFGGGCFSPVRAVRNKYAQVIR